MKIKLPQQADSIVNEGDRLTDIDTTSLSHNEHINQLLSIFKIKTRTKMSIKM